MYTCTFMYIHTYIIKRRVKKQGYRHKETWNR